MSAGILVAESHRLIQRLERVIESVDPTENNRSVVVKLTDFCVKSNRSFDCRQGFGVLPQIQEGLASVVMTTGEVGVALHSIIEILERTRRVAARESGDPPADKVVWVLSIVQDRLRKRQNRLAILSDSPIRPAKIGMDHGLLIIDGQRSQEVLNGGLILSQFMFGTAARVESARMSRVLGKNEIAGLDGLCILALAVEGPRALVITLRLRSAPPKESQDQGYREQENSQWGLGSLVHFVP